VTLLNSTAFGETGQAVVVLSLDYMADQNGVRDTVGHVVAVDFVTSCCAKSMRKQASEAGDDCTPTVSKRASSTSALPDR
jgi:hypothetical protein